MMLFAFIVVSSCMTPENTVIVAYYPSQCWATAWESQWMEDNDQSMADWYDLTEDQRLTIIEDHVENDLNVEVYDIEYFPMPPDMGVCAACGCPRGYHYELTISEDDLAVMQISGFRLVEEEE
jgi:hypothetical protein